MSAELSSLRDRVAELEEEVRQLTRPTPAEFVFPPEARLSPLESGLLFALYKRDVLSHDAACATINSITGRDSGSTNEVTVYIFRLRAKLKSLGFNVITVRGVGYRLSNEARALVAKWQSSARTNPAIDSTETTEPRVFITVERLLRGQRLANRKEISLELLRGSRIGGKVLLTELEAALKEIEMYR